ncbi:hypothetical protein V6N12_003396 [Hibiscus sabdariffa]|uniref:DUF7903 domain-containing protein n=1 Tax=Hibiscus sabdariffa TaxID=183260 RepID=A0ABR2B5B5_9ROSI
MAYIPPHKRQSKDSERPSPMPTPTPTPECLSHRFNRNVRLGASKFKAVYSNQAISRWFAVGWNGHGDALFVVDKTQGCPCSTILENVMPELLSSVEKLKAEIKREDLKDVKLAMAARFGTILFKGSPSVNLDNVIKDGLGNLRRTFYTNLPASYATNILAEVASKIGVDFADVKHSYQVKLELNLVRDMLIDISCMDRDLDLRLSLTHKRVVTSLHDDEMQCIQNLINSAVLDPDVKGGLRWPFGKASSGS